MWDGNVAVIGFEYRCIVWIQTPIKAWAHYCKKPYSSPQTGMTRIAKWAQHAYRNEAKLWQFITHHWWGRLRGKLEISNLEPWCTKNFLNSPNCSPQICYLRSNFSKPFSNKIFIRVIYVVLKIPINWLIVLHCHLFSVNPKCDCPCSTHSIADFEPFPDKIQSSPSEFCLKGLPWRRYKNTPLQKTEWRESNAQCCRKSLRKWAKKESLVIAQLGDNPHQTSSTAAAVSCEYLDTPREQDSSRSFPGAFALLASLKCLLP